MPLNLKDLDEMGKEEGEPQPISRPQKKGGPTTTTLILVLSVIVVIVAVLFLLYVAGIIGKQSSSPDRTEITGLDESTVVVPPDTAVNLPPLAVGEGPVPPGDMGRKEVEPRPVIKPLGQSRVASSGPYTIFIASHAASMDAEEEVKRWKEAGYAATVKEARVGGRTWHRVSLGTYATVSDARADAMELQQAFETGYWIGKVR